MLQKLSKYNNFNLTDNEKKSAETVFQKIKSQLVIQQNVLFERWHFHNLLQSAQ